MTFVQDYHGLLKSCFRYGNPVFDLVDNLILQMMENLVLISLAVVMQNPHSRSALLGINVTVFSWRKLKFLEAKSFSPLGSHSKFIQTGGKSFNQP